LSHDRRQTPDWAPAQDKTVAFRANRIRWLSVRTMPKDTVPGACCDVTDRLYTDQNSLRLTTVFPKYQISAHDLSLKEVLKWFLTA